MLVLMEGWPPGPSSPVGPACVRQFGVGFVLNLAFRQRLGGIVINPAGPSAGISSFQIWHILGNPALEG
ncbi:MAG: hypothetical protein ACHP7K_10410 [Actinomycetales bacterium]